MDTVLAWRNGSKDREQRDSEQHKSAHVLLLGVEEIARCLTFHIVLPVPIVRGSQLLTA